MATAIASIIIVLLGLFGVIVPILPGVMLAWVGLLFYAFKTDFETISITTVIIFLVLSLATLILDLLAPIMGAKRYKASGRGIFGASIGFLLGVFFLGPAGIIVGPFLGALLGELSHGGNNGQVVHTAVGTLVGFLFSTLVKLCVALVILGFLLSAIF
ncbi:MAG TPA: DUF456 domain-containing protein [Candidatus Paceibacterota bacterium]